MSNEINTETLTTLLKADEAGVLNAWVDQQLAGSTFRSDRMSRKELTEESQHFLRLFTQALVSQSVDIQSPPWAPARQMLEELSSTRAQQGFTPSETATFVFSLKQVLFERIVSALASKPAELAGATWTTSTLLDRLGLYTTEVFLRTREQLILRQQQEMLELSTPVVTLWEGILALPLIGTLDSARTQVVMESLLQKIVDSGALVAIPRGFLEVAREGCPSGRGSTLSQHPNSDCTNRQDGGGKGPTPEYREALGVVGRHSAFVIGRAGLAAGVDSRM